VKPKTVWGAKPANEQGEKNTTIVRAQGEKQGKVWGRRDHCVRGRKKSGNHEKRMLTEVVR